MESGFEAQIEGRALTPMMRQYLRAKAENPSALLMFRMGDFFEMFFEDARIAAKELGIMLTSRDKDRGDGGTPMAGVPHHAVGSYVARLVDRGFTVALCDQVEDPKKAKGLVKREITQLVTPGTLSDLDALDPAAPSYVAFVGAAEGSPPVRPVGALELLAGELLVTHCDEALLADELRRLGVRELLVPDAERSAVERLLGPERQLPLRPLTSLVGPAAARRALADRFGNEALIGQDGPASDGQAVALVELVRFAEATQRRALAHLMKPRAYRVADTVILDETTRRNLELTTTLLDNRRQGSLLWHLDRCRTAMGSRRLGQWLLFPLREPAAIEERLDAVQALKDDRGGRETISRALDGVRDLERLLGRVAIGRATPRDLGAVRGSLQQIPALRAALAEQRTALGRRWRELDPLPELAALLERALVDEPPLACTEAGIFRPGYDAPLDELAATCGEGHGFLVDLERRERARTGIHNLKVRFNKVFGYYIEVTKANLAAVPSDYVRKQTLVNAERYITDELKRFEDRVLNADERRKARELELFAELVDTVAAQGARLRTISRLLAETDALASLAQVADEGRYCRPELVAEPVLALEASRHPVIERLLPGGERFVPNDLRLDADGEQLVILTGPNMAGKSTVMRQAALVAILAQMGSFVPARTARVGLCDRIFTRVGAADNLGRGRSTFMVEMLETASILRHATRQSLVLLDEVGRGTSTFDGVSIAWAVAEELHDRVGCRTLFATHYHELTALAEGRARIVNRSIAVQERDGRVVFLRRLVDGPANRSYGIQVAALAGLPGGVLRRAREVLGELERRQSHPGRSEASPPAPAAPEGALEAALDALDPLNLTPLQALAALDRLKTIRADGAPKG